MTRGEQGSFESGSPKTQASELSRAPYGDSPGEHADKHCLRQEYTTSVRNPLPTGRNGRYPARSLCSKETDRPILDADVYRNFLGLYLSSMTLGLIASFEGERMTILQRS